MPQAVLVPFIISRDDGSDSVPMGDAILSVPMIRAAEGLLKLFMPEGFVSELLAELAPDVEQVRSYEDAWICCPSNLVYTPENPYFIARWGASDFIAKHGPLNATQCWAAAVGLALADPVPRLLRPRPPESKRVVVFPQGSVEKRSMLPPVRDALVERLSKEGYDVRLCPNFAKASELAAFVASCEYAVGVYTGPTHLAAAMGVKTVAISLGDSAFAYRPLQENVHVLAPPCDLCWFLDKRGGAPYCKLPMPNCQASLTPESVLSALRKLDAGKGSIELLPGSPFDPKRA